MSPAVRRPVFSGSRVRRQLRACLPQSLRVTPVMDRGRGRAFEIVGAEHAREAGPGTYVRTCARVRLWLWIWIWLLTSAYLGDSTLVWLSRGAMWRCGVR